MTKNRDINLCLSTNDPLLHVTGFVRACHIFQLLWPLTCVSCSISACACVSFIRTVSVSDWLIRYMLSKWSMCFFFYLSACFGNGLFPFNSNLKFIKGFYFEIPHRNVLIFSEWHSEEVKPSETRCWQLAVFF